MRKNYLPFLKRLRNVEFPVAYDKICSQFEDVEFEVVNVQLSFDSAMDYLQEVVFLKNMRLQHPLTEIISQQKNERHQHLLSLRGRVTYFTKSPIVNERSAARILEKWLYGYREDFTNPSINGQTGIIINMMTNINESSVLQQAVEDLNLMSTFDSVSSMTTIIKENDNVRLDERKALLLKAKKIRDAGYKKMKTFRNSIELEIDLNSVNVEKFTKYLDDINWAMTDFRTSCLSKTTRKKNAALKDEEENEEDESDKESGNENQES